MDYSVLKSGTDVRGIATDKGGRSVNLTEKAVYDITAASLKWFCNKNDRDISTLKVSIGHDSRITADIIAKNVLSAVTDCGANAFYCDLSSTPAMFFTTVDLSADLAIQITASHHPFDRNGLKFFTKAGGLDTSDISEILLMASQNESISEDCKGVVTNVDYMQTYSKRLRDMICEGLCKNEADMPLSGYHIIVDAGNGAGGFYVNDVLKPLGANTEGSQFLEPDGMFPNHIPNPENETAMQSICSAVINNKADLGVIFDTDVDRAGCVGKDGSEINRNRLVALASYIALKDNEGGTVVTDSIVCDGVRPYIENTLKSKHCRYMRGYKNVINKAVSLCASGIDCPLAIETSGHAAFRQNHFLDDGAYLATKIIIELAKGIDIEKILKALKTPAEEDEIRLTIKSADFKNYGMAVVNKLKDFANGSENCRLEDVVEGARVVTDFGIMHLRLSVHDPVMPINFESDTVGGVERLKAFFKDFYEQFSLLDLSNYK